MIVTYQTDLHRFARAKSLKLYASAFLWNNLNTKISLNLEIISIDGRWLCSSGSFFFCLWLRLSKTTSAFRLFKRYLLKKPAWLKCPLLPSKWISKRPYNSTTAAQSQSPDTCLLLTLFFFLPPPSSTPGWLHHDSKQPWRCRAGPLTQMLSPHHRLRDWSLTGFEILFRLIRGLLYQALAAWNYRWGQRRRLRALLGVGVIGLQEDCSLRALRLRLRLWL